VTQAGRGAPYGYRFAMVSVAVDIVLFNKPPQGGLRVALVRRAADAEAFPNTWALPGGFFRADQDQDITA
jgi:ADP-ribose pyrophosphatase YjhB (NUDIX family)